MAEQFIKFSDLNGKVVVIAGATGLIGSEISKSFVEQGSKVIFGSRTDEKGEKLKEELLGLNQGLIDYYQLDVSSEESVDKFIKNILEKYEKIDVFVNCSWPGKDISKNVSEVVSQHIGGFYSLTEKIINQMENQKNGSVILFGSIYGIVAPDFKIYEETGVPENPVSYALSKGAITQMTRYLATRYADVGIRVNCIAPGGIFNNHDEKFVQSYSERVPLKRMGKSDEMNGLTLLLASNASSYMTGSIIPVDGGLTAW